MRVYIASAFTERFWCRIVEQVLQEKGYRVTSQWHDLKDDQGNEDVWARNCVEHIDQADILLLFVAGQSEGGRWTEMGLAIGQGKPVIIVGETKNIFRYLPNVTVCSESNWLTVVTNYKGPEGPL